MRKTVSIQNTKYTLLVQEEQDSQYRHSLNRLTKAAFGFTFEQWYQKGCWGKNCVGYSLLFQGEVVSHVTVSPIRFFVFGQEKQYTQLGTVTTAKEFRGRGLSRFLMEYVLADWAGQSDLIYLFANDSVLGFYPKFGFAPAREYQTLCPMPQAAQGVLPRKMDMQNPKDQQLLWQFAEKAVPQYQLAMVNNPQLVLLYACCFEPFSCAPWLYCLPKLNAIAVAEYTEETLLLYDILAPQPVSVNHVLSALVRPGISHCALQWVPLEPSGNGGAAFEVVPYTEEDSTLFLLGKDARLFREQPLRFPLLSHT